MAIDDNKNYVLSGAQIKDLPGKINAVKGLAKELTAADYDYPTGDPRGWRIRDLSDGSYIFPAGSRLYYYSSDYFVPLLEDTLGIIGGDTALLFRATSSGTTGTELHLVKDATSYSNVKNAGVLTQENVVDNLTSTLASVPLSANQGKVLKDMIDAITGFSYEVVQTLPASGQNGKIYLVPIDESGGPADNIYEEYIWVNNAWEMIGTTEMDLTNYVQFSDLAAGLATKQNLLTAGSNIQINNDTISATDTTYSNFVGTDGTSAGTSGLVPAPATTDAGKVLGADGTWVTGGPTVVQTTGTSTTDVMSQNAVTSMIYNDPGTKTKIVIGGGTIAGATNPVAIGRTASVRGDYAVAIGSAAGSQAADAPGGISLGAFSMATGRGQMDISLVSATPQTQATCGYNGSGYRLLTGLYDPQSAHDAATKGYVDSVAPTITMTATDPGEGVALAENNYIGVYGGDPIIMDYSTSEVNTGAKWIDGSAIYKKTVDCGTLPNNTNVTVPHNISNLSKVIRLEGYAYDQTEGKSQCIPFVTSTGAGQVSVSVKPTIIELVSGADRSSYTDSCVTIYYTKSS